MDISRHYVFWFNFIFLTVIFFLFFNNGSLLYIKHIYTPKPCAPHTFKQNRTCQEKQHVVFLKTHKCGSTTLHSIFFRFGLVRRLKFASSCNSKFLSVCKPFQATNICREPGFPPPPFDIITFHLKWNTEEIRKVVPTDTIYTSIVRDPVDAFESMYGHYNGTNRYGIPLTEFAYSKDKQILDKKFNYECLGRNNILRDFGLSPNDLYNVSKVESKIEEIREVFHFIMVSEYFDESLVMLKDLLCWDFEDILYIKHNERRNDKRIKLNITERNELRKLLWPDQMLYDTFLALFRTKMKLYGEERLEREVAEFRKKNNVLQLECKRLLKYKNRKRKLVVPEECTLYYLLPNRITDDMIKQYERLSRF